MHQGLYNCTEHGWTRAVELEVCRAFGSSGNSDLNGIGVRLSHLIHPMDETAKLIIIKAFIAYIIELVLVTCYAFSATRAHSPDSPYWDSDRFAFTFTSSSITFLNSTMMFAFVLQCANLVFGVHNFRAQPRAVTTYYTCFVSMMASLFSVYCAAVTQCMVGRTRRWKLRVASWVIVICLVFVNAVIFLRTGPHIRNGISLYGGLKPETAEELWEKVCYGKPNPSTEMWVYGGSAVLIFIVLWECFFCRCVPYERVKRVGSRLIAVICFLGMLTTFGVIALKRREQILKASHEHTEDDKWTFGQILALATWLSVVTNWLGILFCESPKPILRNLTELFTCIVGAEEVFEGQLTTQWKVICLEDHEGTRSIPESEPYLVSRLGEKVVVKTTVQGLPAGA